MCVCLQDRAREGQQQHSYKGQPLHMLKSGGMSERRRKTPCKSAAEGGLTTPWQENQTEGEGFVMVISWPRASELLFYNSIILSWHLGRDC